MRIGEFRGIIRTTSSIQIRFRIAEWISNSQTSIRIPMQVSPSRILSLVILILSGLFFWWSEGPITEPRVMGNFLAVILIGVALIWFPEELGSFTGYLGQGANIDTETPPILLKVLGWCLLIGMVLILCHLRSTAR